MAKSFEGLQLRLYGDVVGVAAERHVQAGADAVVPSKGPSDGERVPGLTDC